MSGQGGLTLSSALVPSRWPLVRRRQDPWDEAALITHEFTLLAKNKLSRQQIDSALTTEAGRALILHLLDTDGILMAQCDWTPEESSEKILEFVGRVGIVNEHNAGGSAVWDVRPMKDGVGNKTKARSHTDSEFAMHTDCSFEDKPPRFMVLYTQKADGLGGGLSKFVDCKMLRRCLKPSSLEVLKSSTFTMRVPEEFRKEADSIRGPILVESEDSGDAQWRYRGETTLRGEGYTTPAMDNALNELDALLSDDRLHLTARMPTGALLVLDNTRWLHGRTTVLDPERHLKRVRFHPLEGAECAFVEGRPRPLSHIHTPREISSASSSP